MSMMDASKGGTRQAPTTRDEGGPCPRTDHLPYHDLQHQLTAEVAT